MTVSHLGIAKFDIRSYLYDKFLNPFVYSISKLDRLLLQYVVAGLFFCLKTKLPAQQTQPFSAPSAIFAPLFGSHISASWLSAHFSG